MLLQKQGDDFEEAKNDDDSDNDDDNQSNKGECPQNVLGELIQ